MELIKITKQNGEQLVSARDLHKFLESKQDFSDWIKARIDKYGFIEDEDFTIILGKSNGGRPSKEYILKLDMAKELSMVEGNKKGKVARKYFIECEKKLNNQLKVPKTYAEALLEAGRLALENEKLLEDNKHKSTLIRGITEELDGVFLRVIAVDYVNKMQRKTNESHAFIWNNIYTILGRKLKKDLPYQLEKFKKGQIALVNKNKKHNSENKLKGIDKLQPYTLKSARADISMVEYVCDILHEGNVLVQVMSEVFEVGIDEIVKKYNHVAMEDAYKRIEM